MRSWKGIGVGVLASVLVGTALPYHAEANTSLVGYEQRLVRGNEVCGVSVRGLEYSNAVELERNGFKNGKDYTYDAKRKMYLPMNQEVRDGLGNMLLMLQMSGVDVNQVIDDHLKYSIVRADMKNILGHAFVWQEKPEIYLYGKYIDFWDDVETEATVVHEFGHYVEAKYMSELDRRIAYAKLRGLPNAMVYGNQDSAEWGDMFEEIFAEDYKTLFVDGSLYKANQKPLSVSKREQLRDMIVGWMVEDMDPSRDVSKELDLIRNSGIVSDGDVLFCDDQSRLYLNEDVGGSDVLNWLVEMYYGKSERVGNALTRRDIDREIHKRYGFYPSDVTALSVSQYKKMIAYFSSEVDRYVTSREGNRRSKTVGNVSRVMGNGYSDYTKRVVGSSVYLNWMHMEDARSYRSSKMTRGELASWIVKSKGVKLLTYSESRKILKNYRDVDASSRYGRYVATAIKNKWMFGVKKGSFGYANVVTKEQSAYLLGKVYGNLETVRKSQKPFKDMNAVSSRYKKDVRVLGSNGILVADRDGKFNPKQDVTRTQWLGMLTRVYSYDKTYKLRTLYKHDGLLSVYGIQSKLLRYPMNKSRILKRDVINWLK